MQVAKITAHQELSNMAETFIKSGFFSDTRDIYQAMVKIQAGSEIGFGPMASMQGIYIVKGKPSLSASLIAALVKKSGRYNYLTLSLTDELCQLEFFENGKSVGVSSFSSKDASAAQTQNMNKFPRNMLFARALTNGVRWYCPDVAYGNGLYTPEELGANVNEEGEIIEASHYRAPASAISQYTEPSELKISPAQRTRLFAMAKAHEVSEDDLRDYLGTVYGVESTKDILAQDYEQICNWLVDQGQENQKDQVKLEVVEILEPTVPAEPVQAPVKAAPFPRPVPNAPGATDKELANLRAHAYSMGHNPTSWIKTLTSIGINKQKDLNSEQVQWFMDNMEPYVQPTQSDSFDKLTEGTD